MALIGPNGAGKTTLLRIVAGDVDHTGAVVHSGGLGIMRQLVGRIDDDRSVRDLLASLAPSAVRAAAAELSASELAMMQVDDEPTQMRYAHALAEWADVGGYQAEVGWDKVTDAVLSIPFERAQYREVRTLSGGEQKRLVLEALLRGSDEVLLLDEPDNFLDVPTKRWFEEELVASPKTVLYVSHDRELLARTATHVASLEPTSAGATVWVHGGGFATFAQARRDRMARLDELGRRWDEEHAKLQELVTSLKVKATFNDGLASRYQAAQTRLRKFEEAGPPQAVVRGSRVRPGWFSQTGTHPELAGRTLLQILHRGDGHRTGLARDAASRALDRYELVASAEQTYDTLSGGQQARFQILLLELSGATLLLLDEPTDNLDLSSAEALERGLAAFEGTVMAVTHDRWFARGFDRFLVFGADGEVVETPEPVWESGRVQRAR